MAKLLNLNNEQRSVLEHWEDGSHVDLGACMEKIMSPWDGTFKTPPEISLDRVDRLLVQTASKSRFSDPAIRTQRVLDLDTDEELKYMLQRLSSWEAKWLIRLLLRSYCTLQLDETFIFKEYHFLLPDLLLFQNDFDAAVQLLRGDLSCFPPVPNAKKERDMRIEASKKLKAVVGTKVGRPTFHKAWSLKNCFQLTGDRAWAAEIKYDGEYCEIHVDLEKSDSIRIFSKNGKDATKDRQALHDTIRRALRIGRRDCPIKRNCILLGEMVIYSDKEQMILPFCKIRKHISRSDSFLGTLQDSLPHDWEHLMIVFFDILVMDDKPILRECFQKRRGVLREVVQSIPGRACRSEWYLIDFKTEDGKTDLKQAFAMSLALRQEGLILKPLHTPYFPLFSDAGHRYRGYFIKLKEDYLADMGGQRDLGDFAIIGGSFDPQVAAKMDMKPLHWTHFHVGCLTNKVATERLNAKPNFKVVATVSIDKCIPKAEARYLNMQGRLRQIAITNGRSSEFFEVQQSLGYGPKMTVRFKRPFVAEILGCGYEQLQNETFEMLRHPRVNKLHHDRTWEDTVTMEDLERMARAKWDVPDAAKLDGHAKDVALYVKRYIKEMGGSQVATTQGNGVRASRSARMLVREDTSERIARLIRPKKPGPDVSRCKPSELSPFRTSPSDKRRLNDAVVSPPSVKRRRVATPLKHAGSKINVGTFECDSQEKTIHVYAEAGWKVKVHDS
ncbi:DNA ligase/mRNA capping enzyme [Westerdykella ornata]|uniref:DNA ligase/mRNA capping enzyme n=1 Tax=Westerdykella ornata TaxID=318751 RepID=A0A6A6JN98_WESOR|nr:DNA ligase/mRNA capping enzyme [Westerdykella ornata]KAF2276399.1 DNA ligase/mRNA capping enzyme [Westerdykella ornata]